MIILISRRVRGKIILIYYFSKFFIGLDRKKKKKSPGQMHSDSDDFIAVVEGFQRSHRTDTKTFNYRKRKG